MADPARRRIFARPDSAADQGGFTLVEMTTSVAVLLVVLTAAWLLLTTSNDNLNRIDYGGQSSELNRAALAAFERDLNHAVLPMTDVSPVLRAEASRCSILVKEDPDSELELVTWEADEVNERLVRSVTQAPDTSTVPAELADFAGGVTTTATVLTGLDCQGTETMFEYRPNAKGWPDTGFDMSKIGLVTFRLRNGLPNSTTNVTDRTGAFRVTVFVINGY